MFYYIFILGAVVLILYLLYKLGTQNYDLFEKQGIKYIKPLPFVGNALDMFKGLGFPERTLNNYRKFPNEKVLGLFETNVPVYVLRCPDLLRQITVKDFRYFQDRLAIVHDSVDDYIGKMLISLCGKEWRDMRATLSPMFTGSKMKTMNSLIVKCCHQVIDFVQDDYNKKGLTAYAVKDMFIKYANDAIATSAFGVECNSLKYPDNEISKLGKGLLQSHKLFSIYVYFLARFLPKIAKLFNLSPVDAVQKKNFTKLILRTMDFRKKEGIVRPDMLQMIMQIRDGQAASLRDDTQEIDKELKILNGNEKRVWSDIYLLAQSFQFYGASIETSATTMTYIAYELAINPDIQEKLTEEIHEVNKNLNGNILNYETLQGMKYLDMVINETLRKWPPAVFTERVCSSDYLYEDKDNLKFVIRKGSIVLIPIYGFHMDPKYFANPKKFDPERFSEENKAERDSIVFMPFGVGPRQCIGRRLALMNIKTIFYHLILNFRIKICEETDVPLKFKRSMWALEPTKSIKLCFEPRSIAQQKSTPL